MLTSKGFMIPYALTDSVHNNPFDLSEYDVVQLRVEHGESVHEHLLAVDERYLVVTMSQIERWCAGWIHIDVEPMLVV